MLLVVGGSAAGNTTFAGQTLPVSLALPAGTTLTVAVEVLSAGSGSGLEAFTVAVFWIVPTAVAVP